jgi:hypothetical protein
LRPVAATVLLLWLVACGPDHAGRADPELSALLPSTDAIEQLDLDLDVPPGAVDRNEPALLPRTAVDFGVADYSLPEPDQPTPYAKSLALYLFRLGDTAEARTFWADNPPERMFRHAAASLDDRDEDLVAERVEAMRFPVATPRSDERWTGFCTTGRPDDEGGCYSLSGWVTFCRWALDIHIDVDRPWSGSRDPDALFVEIAGVVRESVGCDPG